MDIIRGRPFKWIVIVLAKMQCEIKNHKWFGTFALFVLLGFALSSLRDQIHLGDFKAALMRANWHYLALAAVLVIVQNELSAQKYKYLLHQQGLVTTIQKIRPIVWKSILVNLVIPSSVGGEVQKYLAVLSALPNEPSTRRKIILAQVHDRVSIYLFFLLYTLFSGGFYYREALEQLLIRTTPATAILIIVSVCPVVLLIRAILKKFGPSLSPAWNFGALCYSAAIAFLLVAKIALCLASVNVFLSAQQLLILGPMLLGAYLIPVGGAAWGARDLVMVFASNIIDIPLATTLSASLLCGFLVTAASIFGSLIFIPSFSQKKLVRLAPFCHLLPIVSAVLAVCFDHIKSLTFFGFLYLLGVLLVRIKEIDAERVGVVNPANFITLVRLALLMALVNLSYEKTVFTAVFLLLLIFDGLDGFAARQLSCATKFGAQFDMETDAFSILVLSSLLVVHESAPTWILCLGGARYLFAFWRGSFFPRQSNERRSRSGRWIFLLVYLSLAFYGHLGSSLSATVCGLALLALAVSFYFDVLEIVTKSQRKHLAIKEA